MSQKFAGQQYEQNTVHVLRKSIVFGDSLAELQASLQDKHRASEAEDGRFEA